MDETEGLQVLRSRHRNGISIGFTGTRSGMAIDQWAKVKSLLSQIWLDRLFNTWHDGDCIGADEQAHMSVEQWRGEDIAKVTLAGHPCNLEKYRAHKNFDIYWTVKAPLERNRDIVKNSDAMIAAPKEFEEQMRGSGTWATIRYARSHRKPLFIVWPDASVCVEFQTEGEKLFND